MTRPTHFDRPADAEWYAESDRRKDAQRQAAADRLAAYEAKLKAEAGK